MKKLLSNIVVIIILMSCKLPDNKNVITPVRFTGTWKLEKILFGFPPPNAPNFTTDVQNQLMVFDESKMSYSLIVDNKNTETGRFRINDDITKYGPSIEFLDINQQSPYELLENGTLLHLYQRAPIGAVLADGSTYQYRKQ